MNLRERKKAHTRTAIEDAALRMFAERGYDATPIDDICEAVLVSRRTFFRYFTSKEDVVLARSREIFALAGESLRRRPRDEPYRESVHVLFDETGAIFDSDRDRHLARMRLLLTVPSLAGSYLAVLSDFEGLLRDFLADRTDAPTHATRVRLAAAAATTAFRVAAEIWLDRGGTPSLSALARDNLDHLATPKTLHE